MDPRLPALAEQLLLIERELRLQGVWATQAPSPEALASTEPFAVDTLGFEEWLQWIFLPRMKEIIESNQNLPTASGILMMAELVYAQQPQYAGLLRALEQFDQLITHKLST